MTWRRLPRGLVAGFGTLAVLLFFGAGAHLSSQARASVGPADMLVVPAVTETPETEIDEPEPEDSPAPKPTSTPKENEKESEDANEHETEKPETEKHETEHETD